MQIRVLGSAAGGGFPQWNCGCANCSGVRTGRTQARARTQESVAISADGSDWYLLNASPEIRIQLESDPALWPREKRHSPVAGVVLTNGDLDHCLGLLSLRESHPICLYATSAVREGFTQGNVLYRTLERFPGQVTWRDLSLRHEIPLRDSSGTSNSGLSITALPVPGKLPLHLERVRAPSPADNIGLRIRDENRRVTVAYLPAVAALSDSLVEAVRDADCVFFDGTFWSSDELIAAGIGTRTAQDMAHWPIGGAMGSLGWLSNLGGRRILIHLNNTNPVLCENGPEHAAVRASGVEIAHDGMEIHL